MIAVSAIPAHGQTFTIANVTHPGLSPSFYYLGDKVQVTATGTPGAQITVAQGSTINTLAAPVYFGTIPAGGTFQTAPTAENTVEVVVEQWFIGGVPIGNPVTITVGSTPQVFLLNTTPGPNLMPNFRAGDTFTLTVVGAPNQPIYVAAGLNGAALGTPTLNSHQTDATGTWTDPYSFSTANVGNWVEKWCVGSPTNCTTITFSVIAGKSKDYVYVGGHLTAIETY